MIIVRYTGGLGNQMFQYAINIMLKQRFTGERVCADLSRYDLTKEHNGFNICKYFNIDIDVADEKEIKMIAPVVYWLKKLHANKILQLLYVERTDRINEYFEKKNKNIGIITDYASTNFNENIYELNEDNVSIWHYKGNWVNPMYWNGCDETVINSFIFKEELLSPDDVRLISEMQSCESVGIHIRQGDYVGNYKFNLCHENYYKKAIERLQNMKQKELKFYIFCEDCDAELIKMENIDYQIISHKDMPGIDLWLMSKCRNNIIANSTFSYWSALLNRNEEKVVIAPKYLARNKEFYVKLPTKDKWIIIDNLD